MNADLQSSYHSNDSDEFMSREQVQAVDRYAIEVLGMPGAVLMENAGRGVAEVLLSQSGQTPRDSVRDAPQVLILCGKGNNGGDGYVVARHLQNAGVSVVVVSTARGEPAGDARLMRDIWERSGQSVIVWTEGRVPASLASLDPDWVVDAMLGTGSQGAVRSPLDTVIPWANALPAKRLAIDLPSGMDCDTGRIGEPAFLPDVTCTFVCNKLGFRHVAPEQLGELLVLDIGAPLAAIEHGRSMEPSHDETAH